MQDETPHERATRHIAYLHELSEMSLRLSRLLSKQVARTSADREALARAVSQTVEGSRRALVLARTIQRTMQADPPQPRPVAARGSRPARRDDFDGPDNLTLPELIASIKRRGATARRSRQPPDR